ncbi:MAG: hypothetical protein JXR64_01535 [Spirochaetales bacterium]|nr:hypothetical protein [Spirochaetales bacterium]
MNNRVRPFDINKECEIELSQDLKENLYKIIPEYIKKRRTVSYGNLKLIYESYTLEIEHIVNNLIEHNKIRIVNSRCSLDCSSCSSCDTDISNKLQESTILISQEFI